MKTPPTRRRVGLLLATFVAATLPVLLPETASAEPGCLTEAAGRFETRCDDEVPPETSLDSVTPLVNDAGWLKDNDVTITFSGSHLDADTGAIGFECQLYLTPEPPAEWKSCSSPLKPRVLTPQPDQPLADSRVSVNGQTTDFVYTFRVRAFDSADHAIDATSSVPIFGPSGAATDRTDIDQTPESTSFKIDTTPPNGFSFGEPSDAINPQWPMITSPRLEIDLETNEPDAVFVCALDARQVPCVTGANSIPARAGDQTLRAFAIDPAGNFDVTPPTVPFAVPINLTTRQAKGWSLAQGDGYFAGDYLQSRKKGATITLRAKRAREIRILAPQGGNLGKVEMQIGAQQPFVPLQQTTRSGGSGTFTVAFQRFFGRKFSGQIVLRVLAASSSKPAKIDAILLH